MRNLIIIFMTLFLTTGCATTPQEQGMTKADVINAFIKSEQLQSVERVRSFKFGGWTVLDDMHLILEKRFNQYVLIELTRRCPDLKFATTLGLDRTNDSTLSVRFDAVLVPGDFAIKCHIKTIYEINKAQRKQLLDDMTSFSNN